MESLYLLIPIALVFVAIAVKIFFWAVNNDQFEDLDTEAHRILFDDDEELEETRPKAAPPDKKSPRAGQRNPDGKEGS